LNTRITIAIIIVMLLTGNAIWFMVDFYTACYRYSRYAPFFMFLMGAITISLAGWFLLTVFKDK